MIITYILTNLSDLFDNNNKLPLFIYYNYY